MDVADGRVVDRVVFGLLTGAWAKNLIDGGDWVAWLAWGCEKKGHLKMQCRICP